MKKTASLVVLLLVALVGFYAWHTPFGGPLTEAEIAAYMAEQEAAGGDAWTDLEAFEAFLREDDGRRFVMINLMEVRDEAEYPDDFAGEPKSGAEADAAYGGAVIPLLLRRGSYPVLLAERYHTIINSLGETAAEFDDFAMVRYRSRRDLIDMLSSDRFREASVHKWASLENTLVAPGRRGIGFQAIGYVPVLLMIAIAIVVGRGVLGRRKRPLTDDSSEDLDGRHSSC
ncbi:MAG: hypothetical protein AAGA20_12200 [Planctomycetota bacterium]